MKDLEEFKYYLSSRAIENVTVTRFEGFSPLETNLQELSKNN